MKGVVQPVIQQVVDLVHLLPGRFQVEAAVHYLKAKVVFFVDHQAKGLLLVDRDAASPGRFGKFAADQLPFDEELAVKLREAADIDVEQVLPLVDRRNGSLDGPLNTGTIRFRTAADEGEVRKVAHKANPAADDNVRLRTTAASILRCVWRVLRIFHP